MEDRGEDFPTFRASTKCKEIESGAKTLPGFRFSTKCKEMEKAGRRLSLHLEPALNVRKYGRWGEHFSYAYSQH